MKNETIKTISTVLTIAGFVISGAGALIGDRVQKILIEEAVHKEVRNLIKKQGT